MAEEKEEGTAAEEENAESIDKLITAFPSQLGPSSAGGSSRHPQSVFPFGGRTLRDPPANEKSTDCGCYSCCCCHCDGIGSPVPPSAIRRSRKTSRPRHLISRNQQSGHTEVDLKANGCRRHMFNRRATRRFMAWPPDKR